MARGGGPVAAMHSYYFMATHSVILGLLDHIQFFSTKYLLTYLLISRLQLPTNPH